MCGVPVKIESSRIGDTLFANGFAGGGQNETCATYNLLKLSRELFFFDPAGKYMDYYEQALYNHILASVAEDNPGNTYHVPLNPGSRKRFGNAGMDGFTCCNGTALESSTKLQDSIYFRSADHDKLYVNLYVPSELTWPERDVVIAQQTDFPYSDTTRLTVSGEGEFTVMVRVPGWATRGFHVAINGEDQTVDAEPGTYLALRRAWRDGDRIDLRMPFGFRLSPVMDQPNIASLFYGPVLLAAEEPEPRSDWRPVTLSAVDLGASITGDPATLRFRTGDADLKPFYETYDRHSVYLDVTMEPGGSGDDASGAPAYVLPDPLTTEAGDPVEDAAAWRMSRRPELMRLFEEQVYGRSPDRPADMSVHVQESAASAVDGTAERRQVVLTVDHGGGTLDLNLLLYLPRNRQGPVPVFLGLNFAGNHTVQDDPAIALSTAWMRDNPDRGVVDHRATDASRGTSSSRWPVDLIVGRGYGLATLYCGDVDPDFDDGFQNGIHPLFYREGQTRPDADEWGSIAAWAWGLSRAMDYLLTVPDIDRRRVAVIGHSRLGKTALWAGARDTRFAMVVSNNSGCGGAALSRRQYGETVARINQSFPHWFCTNFKQYNDAEDRLPIDQHQLIALIAPRPVYIASATEDQWADPLGEFLSGVHAEPVYRLFGKTGLGTSTPPNPDQPVGDSIRYHIRTGRHDITPYDWEQYLDFADRQLPQSR